MKECCHLVTLERERTRMNTRIHQKTKKNKKLRGKVIATEEEYP